MTVQTVRDAAGHVYKRAISARKGMGAYGRMPRAEAAAEASSAALAEGFDDWVITGPVDVAEGMELTFLALHDGLWYFSMENLDWETGEYIDPKEVIYDQKIMISEDGGQTPNASRWPLTFSATNGLTTLFWAKPPTAREDSDSESSTRP